MTTQIEIRLAMRQTLIDMRQVLEHLGKYECDPAACRCLDYLDLEELTDKMEKHIDQLARVDTE